MNEKLTLKSINDKIEQLNEKLERLLNSSESENINKVDADIFTLTHNGNFDDINIMGKSPAFLPRELKDGFNNVFIELPTIWVSYDEKKIRISFENRDDIKGWTELKPQVVSKYKNALIDGKVRSISGVAPNFNQMSYLRFEEFIKWAGGEMLNWKTVLYLQILWLFTKKTKETKGEDYNWNTERYTGYQNTGKGIGEFLGIEQLFSGYTLFSLENNDDPLFELFKKMGMETAEDYNDKFGYYRNFFDTRWAYGFNYAWVNDYYSSARLCLEPSWGG